MGESIFLRIYNNVLKKLYIYLKNKKLHPRFAFLAGDVSWFYVSNCNCLFVSNNLAVVYLSQLSGTAHIQKLVELLFWPFLTFFIDFSIFLWFLIQKQYNNTTSIHMLNSFWLRGPCSTRNLVKIPNLW